MHQCFQMNRLDGLCTKIYFYHRKRDSFGNLDQFGIFVDVEGTKEVKRMINLLAITVNLYHEIDADPSGSGSKTDRVRK